MGKKADVSSVSPSSEQLESLGRREGLKDINFLPTLTNGSDEGLTLETSAFLPCTVANLRFQPSC